MVHTKDSKAQVGAFLVLVALLFSTQLSAKRAPEPPTLSDLSDEALLVELKQNVGGGSNVVKKTLKRLGNKTIEMQTFLSTEGTLESAAKILTNIKRIPLWALSNINVSPSGRDYHFKILGAEADATDPAVLSFNFVLDVPFFSSNGVRKFKLTPESSAKVFTIHAETLPAADSVIATSTATMKVFPAPGSPGRLWVVAFGKVVIRSWLLYEALPEKVVARESGERVEAILTNYQSEVERIQSEKSEPVKGKSEVAAGRK